MGPEKKGRGGVSLGRGRPYLLGMNRTKRTLLSIVIAAGVLAPAAAAKTKNVAPPGNSAISQYVESIPTASGNKPSSSLHSGGGSHHGGGTGGGTTSGGGTGGGGSIPSSTQQQLAASGAAGAQAAALAQATAPTGHRTGRQTIGSSAPGFSTGSPQGSHGSGGAVQGAGASAVHSFETAFTGSSSSSGLGSLLPVILVITLVGSAVMAIVRRRQQA
jgi:hypothetical protein